MTSAAAMVVGSGVGGALWWRHKSQSGRSVPLPPVGSLNGRTAFVTGGTSGLGLALVRLLHANGARVAFSGRSEERLAAVAAELPGTVPVRLDLRDAAAVVECAQSVATQLGPARVDMLFLNAGATYSGGAGSAPAPAAPAAGWAEADELFRSNFLGHMLLTLCLLRSSKDPQPLQQLSAGESSTVVLVGSALMWRALTASNCNKVNFCPPQMGRSGLAALDAYATSKMAMALFAAELERRVPGVRARVLLPGMVASSLGVPEAHRADLHNTGHRNVTWRRFDAQEAARYALGAAALSLQEEARVLAPYWVPGGMLGSSLPRVAALWLAENAQRFTARGGALFSWPDPEVGQTEREAAWAAWITCLRPYLDDPDLKALS